VICSASGFAILVGLFLQENMINNIIDLLRQPWSWYVSGLVIAVIMAALLLWGKQFGFSSNLRTICALCGAGKKVSFFNFNWKDQKWNLLFLIGAILGGIISGTLLRDNTPMNLSSATIIDLKELGISFDGQMNPSQIFGTDFLFSVKGIIVLAGGGFLVGFGSRYAGGCTSGHAISGLSNLQRASLIAVVGFFAGGLVMTHIFLPLIF